MKHYRIKYSDESAEATTIIDSSVSLEVGEAKSLIKEQLLENGINEGDVIVKEFREIDGLLDWAKTNIERFGF